MKGCLKELKEIVKSKVIAEEDTEMNQSSEEEVKRAVIDEEYTSITLWSGLQAHNHTFATHYRSY